MANGALHKKQKNKRKCGFHEGGDSVGRTKGSGAGSVYKRGNSKVVLFYFWIHFAMLVRVFQIICTENTPKNKGPNRMFEVVYLSILLNCKVIY